MVMVQSLSILLSLSEPFTGLTAGLSGGTTGGMIPIIIPTGTTPGGTGTTVIMNIMITGGTDGTPGIIATSTGATGVTGLPGGLSRSVPAKVKVT
jgi:hypothetical protein